jgi:hypothetical protein
MYAAALKKGLSNSVTATNNEELNRDTTIKFGGGENNYTTRRPNYIYTRNSSYDGWERVYFREILELRDIYISVLGEIDNQTIIYLNSPEFLYKFGQFIYKNSSTSVTRFLEPLSNELENIYREYKEIREQIN